MMSNTIPHVALIVESSNESGREITRGIAKYSRESGPWSIFHQPSHFGELFPSWIKEWDGDGIIARVGNRDLTEAIKKTGIPAIDVLGESNRVDLPFVHVNDHAIAKAAFEHLFECGFKNFAFVGAEGYNWSDHRLEAFRQIVENAGCAFSSFALANAETSQPWEKEQNALAKWLNGLNKPCGLMACNDHRGQRALDACKRAEILVPEEIAVIGVDNDSTVCELSNPSLTSIMAGHFQVGYIAAVNLQTLMNGGQISEKTLVDNAVCVPRGSTDVTAVENPVLASSLAFIRKSACSGITCRNVAEFAGLSLSSLKRVFATDYHRTINECIIRTRIDTAKRLLRDTELTIEQITKRIGYGHAHYFSVAFRRETGLSPSEYRKENME